MKKYKEYLVLSIIISCFILITLFFEHQLNWITTSTNSIISHKPVTVVIDPGHGGMDPGKIGVDGTLEKDINLKIACKLRTLLEQEDIHVVLTREDDNGLYDSASSNKKIEDMKNRVSKINDSSASLVVSIHQNSYHQEAIHGAQVFYYSTSKKSNELADLIQKNLIIYVDPTNKREAKANSSYYVLKKTSLPIVIVECGFLSNWDESKKIVDDTYQNKLVWAIHMGILQWLNSHTSK